MTILKAENISKQYRLGQVGTGTLSHDLNRFWHNIRGKEDPYLKVGAVNDRSSKTKSEYVWALRDINFEVKQGEVLGIIGKNGAGKSTLLKILSRVTSPTTGVIKTRGRIASLLEVGTGFHPELTGRENIFLNGAILGMTRSEINSKLEEIIEFSGCEMYVDTPVKRYSSGMKVRLAFAVAAHLEPDILVVDEVLAVGDAEFQKKAIGKMQDISKEGGRTVLFVSHNMAAVQSLCTRGLLIENGRKVFEGTAKSVVERYIFDAKKAISKEEMISDANRKSPRDPRLKLISISSINTIQAVRSSLLFEIGFEVFENIQQEISITGSICKLDDSRIGSFFSNKLPTKIGINSFLIEIANHNLSVGTYYLNFSVATGSVETDNLSTLDHAYQAILFEITQEDTEGDYLTEWRDNWGACYFESNLQPFSI